jgi:hypothetical protein
VHTLGKWKSVQRRSSEEPEQVSGLGIKHLAAWLCCGIVEHIQKIGKKIYNLFVYTQNGCCNIRIFFEKLSSSIAIVTTSFAVLDF